MKKHAVYGYNVEGKRVKAFLKKSEEDAKRINEYLKSTNSNLHVVMKEEDQYCRNDNIKFRLSYQSNDILSGKVEQDVGDNRLWVLPERINGKFLAGRSRERICIGKNMIIK